MREVLLYATAWRAGLDDPALRLEGGAGARRLVRRGRGKNLRSPRCSRSAARPAATWVEADGRCAVAPPSTARDRPPHRPGADRRHLFSGLSLGSILLLAALGLAITYGVMGVINMAHGELLMVGAYATWLVRACSAPTARNIWTGTCWRRSGGLPRRGAGRHRHGAPGDPPPYGRPLESLLATWGLSLC